MAASFALRIHVPAEPQKLFLHFQGTPLRLDTVTSSGSTRAVGPRRSTTTTTTWTTGSPTSPSSFSSPRGSDGKSAHRDELPTSDGTARAPRRLPLTRMPSLSEPAESRFLVRERNTSTGRKSRRKLRQQPRQELLLAEASRPIRLTNADHTPSNPPRAVPVEPAVPAVPASLAGAGPIALDPAISSLRGRFSAVLVGGNREENVALAPGTTCTNPENASSATKTLGAPPAPSTLLPPAMAEDRRLSPAVAERAAVTTPAGNATAALPVRCQCGLVSFSTPDMAPVALYHCHCTECRKQSASAFGTSALYPAAAFFPLAAAAAQRLRCWTRPTDAGGRMHCYFCPDCGSRLFHRAVDADGTPRATVSLKAGCVEGLDWRRAVHIYTRSAVVAIPDGAERYDTLPDETPREQEGDGEDGTTPRLR